jgi:hypothetical protein
MNKKVYMLLGLSFAGFSTLSHAGGDCQRSGQSYLCAGDKVIDTSDGWSGTVLGANPWGNKVSVRWTSDERGSSRFQTSSPSVSSLAVNVGCLRKVCVGDKVYDLQDGWSGTVKGVNPYNNKAAVLWTSDERGNSRFQMAAKSAPSLAINRGCIRGFCVGDEVIDLNDSWSGVVKAVNRRSREAVVLWTRDDRGFSRFQVTSKRLSSLASSKFCADYDRRHRVNDYYIPYPGNYYNPVRLENSSFDDDAYFTVRGNY